MADKEIKEASEEVVEATEETAVEEVAEAPKAKEAKPEKAEKAEKKPGLFKRIGASLKKFRKTMKSELHKITWYNRKQTFNSTLLVIVSIVVFGVAIGVLDWGFSNGLEALANLF